MDKEIIKIQIALFFKNDYLGSFEEFSLKIKEKIGNSINTQIIPVPQEAPSNFPRLILNYNDFSLNVSKNRIDLFFTNFSDHFNIKAKKLYSIIDILFSFDLKIGRVGFVKTFTISENIDYLKTLLNEDKISGLDFKEINIRINAKDITDLFECNNIQIIANRSADGKTLITRDLNTVVEGASEEDFDMSTVASLVSKFNTKSEDLIYA